MKKVIGIESDAWVTKDGVAVLNHDSKISRFSLSHKSIAKKNSDELPDRVLTLKNFYGELGSDFEFSLDIKDPTAINAVIASTDLDKQARLWLCSGDFEALLKWRQKWPHLNLVHSSKSNKLGKSPESHLRDLAEAEIQAFNLHFEEYSPGLCSLIHRFGVMAFSWGVNNLRKTIELLDMGVDAIYGDDLEILWAGFNEIYRPLK